MVFSSFFRLSETVYGKCLTILITCLILISSQSAWSHGEHKHNKGKNDSLSIVKENTVINYDEPVLNFPTLHPLIVHFPIMLLLVAAVMQLPGLRIRNSAYHVTITILIAVGFITALVASYYFHPHTSASIGIKARKVLENHEMYANWTTILSGIAAALKLISVFYKRKWLEVLVTVTLISAAILVSMAGHNGAELVHKFGIGPKGDFLEENR